MSLVWPDRAAFVAGARAAATASERSVRVDPSAMRRILETLSSRPVPDTLEGLVLAVMEVCGAEGLVPGAQSDSLWVSAHAAAAVNDATIGEYRLEPILARAGSLTEPLVGLRAWLDQVLTPARTVETPPDLIRAVIATARTGHPRSRLQKLDTLSGAVAAALRNKGLTVRELALGERRSWAPAEADAHDRAQADAADLFIAFLHPPSVGVGLAIAYAARHYPVMAFVAEPGEPIPPLIDGMQIYAELLHAGDESALVANVLALLKRRGREIMARSERRLAADARWSALRGQVAPTWALPDWLPEARARELLDDPARVASATTSELEWLSTAARVAWPALAPDADAELAVSSDELRVVLGVAESDGWPPRRVQALIDAVERERSPALMGSAARSSVRLQSPQDVREYAARNAL